MQDDSVRINGFGTSPDLELRRRNQSKFIYHIALPAHPENVPAELTRMKDAPSHRPLSLLSIGLVMLTAMLWGGTPVAIRFSAETHLPPIAMAALRFALAAVFMVIWCRVERIPLMLRDGQIALAVCCGLILFFQIALFNWGVYYSNASHGSMHINTFVFWVVAIEHFVTKTDRLTPRRLLGLFVAAAGTFLILAETSSSDSPDVHRDAPTLRGDAFLLASAFVLGIKIVFVKHCVKTIEPAKLILWHAVVGVICFATYSAFAEKLAWSQFTAPAVLSVLYQGVLVAGVCFAIQAMLLRWHSATQIAVFSFTTPLFGVAFAVLFRGDSLSPWLFVSAICVAFGILLVNFRTDPAHRKKGA